MKDRLKLIDWTDIPNELILVSGVWTSIATHGFRGRAWQRSTAD